MLTTRTKIALARLAQAPFLTMRRLCGQGPVFQTQRRGIKWNLDLQEGIDFSIFLLGAFEPDTLKLFERMVKPGMTVLDIGANIGAHTLHLGRLVGPDGFVMAFEPTEWAHEKLKTNLALNPDISARVHVRQTMLVADDKQVLPDSIPSSWPLQADKTVHPKLRGKSMSTDGSNAMTADDCLAESNVNRVDFIKLDVDGFECDVLAGMVQTLREAQPVILMELSPYVMEERGHSVEKLMSILDRAGYRLFALNAETPLPWTAGALHALVPDGAGRNVVAKPIG